MSVPSQAISARSSVATDLPNFQGYRPSVSKPAPHDHENPLGELLTDDLYELMLMNDLINEKGLRDFLIRKTYQKIREEYQLSRSEALDHLQKCYPYLQPDSLRKIVYKIYSNTGKKRML